MTNLPTKTYPYFAMADLRNAKNAGTDYTFRFATDDPLELGLLRKQVEGSRHSLKPYRQHLSTAKASQHNYPLFAASTEIDYLYLQLEPGLGCITGTWFPKDVSGETPEIAE